MKTPAKIIILTLCIIVAIGAVLVFIKTQLAPPGNVEFKDAYSAPLNADVEKVGTKQFPQCKSDYVKAYHKVNFMNQEELLSNDQADGIIVKIDTVYGNRLVGYAYRIFNSSNWPDSDLDLITSTIGALRGDRLRNGQRAITQEMDESFRQVDGILANYRSAWAFARNTGFSSVADASSRISSIDSYRNKPYLSNNSSLMTALNNLPSAIANSHYNHVAAQVNKLGGYARMSQSQFNSLVDQVLSTVEQYKATNIYGGSKKSIASLEQKGADIIDRAYEYYANQEYENYDF